MRASSITCVRKVGRCLPDPDRSGLAECPPGLLRDEHGDGRVTAGLAVEYGDVHRDNVAAFIDAALHNPALNRTIVELTDGQTPADEAVSQLVSGTARGVSRDARQVDVIVVEPGYPPCIFLLAPVMQPHVQ